MDGVLVAEYYKLQKASEAKVKIRLIVCFVTTRGKIDLMGRGNSVSVLCVLLQYKVVIAAKPLGILQGMPMLTLYCGFSALHFGISLPQVMAILSIYILLYKEKVIRNPYNVL